MNTHKERIYFDHKVRSDQFTNRNSSILKKKIVKYSSLVLGVIAAGLLFYLVLGLVSKF